MACAPCFHTVESTVATMLRSSAEACAELEELAVVTTLAGVVRQATPAVAQLLHVNAVTGKLLIAFVVRGDTRAFRGWLRALQHPETPRSISVRLRPRGQRPFLASLSATDVIDHQGTVIGLRWTIGVAAGEVAPVRPAAPSSPRLVSGEDDEPDADVCALGLQTG
jgi:hypothetical protein